MTSVSVAMSPADLPKTITRHGIVQDGAGVGQRGAGAEHHTVLAALDQTGIAEAAAGQDHAVIGCADDGAVRHPDFRAVNAVVGVLLFTLLDKLRKN